MSELSKVRPKSAIQSSFIEIHSEKNYVSLSDGRVFSRPKSAIKDNIYKAILHIPLKLTSSLAKPIDESPSTSPIKRNKKLYSATNVLNGNDHKKNESPFRKKKSYKKVKNLPTSHLLQDIEKLKLHNKKAIREFDEGK